jgi:hypothetical protein
MTKNILSLNDFKSKKSVNTVNKSVSTPVNEMVEAIDDFYRVTISVDLPKSLVASYIKKVKESTGKDLRANMGEMILAENLVKWANENYLNIENLPTEIVTGADKSPVQAQAQAQSQVQPQLDGEPEDIQSDVQVQTAQPQSQGESQPTQNSQAQKPAVQVQGVQSQGQGQAQRAAAQIPAQEI